MRVSLWLMPPARVRKPLKDQIVQLSEKYSGSAPFEPHVTILGGLECESLEQALEWSQILSEGLETIGKIPCRFEKTIVSMQDEEDNYIWNQASVAIMEPSFSYQRLVLASGALLGVDASNSGHLNPIGKPHLSFYYGTKRAPPSHEVTPPPDFFADELAIFLTEPGSVEGVAQWKELASVKLLDTLPN